MSFDLTIFDCDGTLVDSEHMNNIAVCGLLAEEGLPQYGIDYALAHFTGLKFSRILANISRETDYAFPANMAERYVARVRELAALHLDAVEGAADLVRAAAARGKICVASNGQRDNVIFSLEKTGLLDFFGRQAVFAGTDVDRPKPEPDIFLLAAGRFGVDPARCLVIEDSIVGVQAGAAAGMTVWGFTGTNADPKNHAPRLRENGAGWVTDRLIHMTERLSGAKVLPGAA